MFLLLRAAIRAAIRAERFLAPEALSSSSLLGGGASFFLDDFFDLDDEDFFDLDNPGRLTTVTLSVNDCTPSSSSSSSLL